ncbi:MAG: radical SAM family heme chaperone HemW [Desulfomonile sp.]|nr:radical SAM family heme chaperone HemW [Desulfomonile sp.]
MDSFEPLDPPGSNAAGIYVHIPFCLARCTYCGFATSIFDRERVRRYVDLLLREIELASAECRAAGVPERRFDTIYFGGGTPSLLNPRFVRRIIEALRRHFNFSADVEITIEINPATVGVTNLKIMRDAGVNRASLGLQSLADDELLLMGRPHSAQDGPAAFSDLRKAGFDNVSVDLIAGFPSQTIQSVTASMRSVMDLRPEHMSIYLLEVKEGSRLALQIERGEVAPPDDDLVANMYEEICNIATTHGYEHYEIANFALPGRCSRHNLKYWQDGDYLGLGMAAHGFINGTRYANHEQPAEYERSIDRGELPRVTITQLSAETRLRDALIMGLRLIEGVDPEVIAARYHVDVCSFVRSAAGDLEDAGLIRVGEDRIVLTPRGRLLSNMVFARFV